MSGIYIHIPFCKQACHYCDFHFSTSLKKKQELIDALCEELVLRKDELIGEVDTIYFGGGTPSLLTAEEIKQILSAVYQNFKVSEAPEITLEANPDDLDEAQINVLAHSEINRLSIGVQSFFEEDLKLMNRAHTVSEAFSSIELALQHFENISLDLIYGIPGMTNERWEENINKALALGVPHLSCYALTVEPKTALKSFIEKGIVPPVDDEVAASHHAILVESIERAGYENYEFSNFSKPGFYSRNNTAYWDGVAYLGIGPSAHSFDGNQRSWNVRNNTKYIKEIETGNLPIEREVLSIEDKYNEYIMTRLRTQKGISIDYVAEAFGIKHVEYLLKQASGSIKSGYLIRDRDRLLVSKKGKFLSDGIASDLFLVNLD